MSTYWGYRCKTDGSESEHWMNHGDRTLRDIAKLASHFKAIREGDTTGYIEVAVVAYGFEPIDWVVEHLGHDVELLNEYGKSESL